MQRLEVFYENGMIDVTDWEAVPEDGIQAIICLHDNGAQEKIHGFDEYTMENGAIIGSDTSGKKGAKRGRLIEGKAFRAIINSLDQRSRIWNAT